MKTSYSITRFLENEQKPTFTGGFVNLGRSRTQGPAMPPLVFWEIISKNVFLRMRILSPF